MKLRFASITFATLASAAGSAAADGVRAQLICGILNADRSGVAVLVPTPDERKLTEDIHCVVHLDGDVKDLRVDVTTDQMASAFYGPIDAGQDFEFSLSPGDGARGEAHYRTCSTFTIRAVISRQDLEPVWEQALVVRQRCAAAAPVKQAPPPPEPASGGVRFENGAGPQLADPAARAIAQEYAAMVQDNDVPFLAANFPKGGRTVKKIFGRGTKKIAKYRADQSLEQQLVIWPSLCTYWNGGFECGADEDPPRTWNAWAVWQKSKNEFWLYHSSSPYGEFPALVFKKKGKTWRWTGMAMYATGEP